jgi:hypothetical protein
MPFEQVVPRLFSATSVREHAPMLSGVYGITNAREWIYIGETDNIQKTLLEHLQESDTSLVNCRPTGFVYEICDLAKRPQRQGRLILEYGPSCNSRPADPR